MTKELQKRIYSSVLLIPLVILLLWAGGVFLAVALGALYCVAIKEWVTISRREGVVRCGLVAFGVIYCALAFLCLYDISVHDPVLWLPLSMFIAVWLSDSGAYLFGKTIGGPKLAPKISPNKTWSGLLGACFGPALGLFVFQILYDYSYGFEHDLSNMKFVILAVEFGIIIGIAGQIGDFSISWMKRKSGVKDTGKLIPGHGGLLDRIDGFLLVAILFWVWMQYGGYRTLFSIEEQWIPVWQNLLPF